MKKYFLNKDYVCSVSTCKDVELRLGANHTIHGTAQGTDDHPKFMQFREQLELDGYIRVEHGWINGDRVLKPFQLHNIIFKKGEQFPCAAALQLRLVK